MLEIINYKNTGHLLTKKKKMLTALIYKLLPGFMSQIYEIVSIKFNLPICVNVNNYIIHTVITYELSYDVSSLLMLMNIHGSIKN